MNITLKIWRQEGAQNKGKLVTYKLSDISEDMSFLEMLDVLNEQLAVKGERAVEFDHDCREGICGQCSLVINGKAHGPEEHLLLAKHICAPLMMVIRLPLSHLEQIHFR